MKMNLYEIDTKLLHSSKRRLKVVVSPEHANIKRYFSFSKLRGEKCNPCHILFHAWILWKYVGIRYCTILSSKLSRFLLTFLQMKVWILFWNRLFDTYSQYQSLATKHFLGMLDLCTKDNVCFVRIKRVSRLMVHSWEVA